MNNARNSRSELLNCNLFILYIFYTRRTIDNRIFILSVLVKLLSLLNYKQRKNINI